MSVFDLVADERLHVGEVAVARGEAGEDAGVEGRAGDGGDRRQAVDLVDRLAQDQAPAAIAAGQEVVEAAGADDVAEHIVDADALGDRHLRLGDRAVAGDVDRRAAEEVQDADAAVPALLADTDEFLVGALPPGRHHAAVLVPDGAEAIPVSGVAPDRPVLDQFADLAAVGGRRRSRVALDCRFQLVCAGADKPRAQHVQERAADQHAEVAGVDRQAVGRAGAPGAEILELPLARQRFDVAVRLLPAQPGGRRVGEAHLRAHDTALGPGLRVGQQHAILGVAFHPDERPHAALPVGTVLDVGDQRPDAL